MTTFVLVHGAFRGGWAWDRVAPLLTAAGHDVVAPTLSGTADSLDSWTADVLALLPEDAVLVGHSQGGVVVREVALRAPDRLRHLVYLDGAVPDGGERAVDLGGVPPELPPRDTLIQPRPLTAAGELDADTATWMNERLAPVPLAPSLDPVSAGVPTVATTYVFFSDTPAGYPSGTTRARLDERGTAYVVLDGGHDGPITRPEAVAGLLLRAATTEETTA